MPDLAHLSRLLAVLSVTVPLLAAAQAPLPPMNDADRARRDAEKVFSFIKFQTVRSKPAAEPISKAARPPAPNADRPARALRPADAAATAPATPPPAAAATPAAAELAPTGAATALSTATTRQPPLASLPAALPAPATALTTASSDSDAMPLAASAPAEAGLEPDEHDPDPDDAALQLQNFVPPVLTPAVQATLGAGSRNIKVRFTVEANGRVSSAEAATGVPRRLAKPATDAILQWQFAPLPQPRTADVEIAFRRD